MKRFLCFVISGMLSLASVPALAEETFVPASEIPMQTNKAILLERMGLFLGDGSGFSLERNVTRAEAAVLLLRLKGDTPADGACPFADIDGHWAKASIIAAYQNGYINGASETEFLPEQTVTGKEFVKMLLNAFGYTDVTLENAYDVGIATELLLNNYTKSAVRENRPLLRNDVVGICHGLLFAKMPDGQMVKDWMLANGIVTEEGLSHLGNGTPAASASAPFYAALDNAIPQDKNYMISPLSVKMALALAANGAAGETRDEMLAVLQISDLDAFNQHSQALIDAYAKNKDVALSIANSIWLNQDNAQGAQFVDAFTNAARSLYQAENGTVNNENALETINGWVSDHTNGKIDSILSDNRFAAALLNAVYFKGAWQNPFRPEQTEKGIFTEASGNTQEIDFMHQTGQYEYYAGDGTEMVYLPYEGGKLGMYVLMGDLSEFDTAKAQMQSRRVALSIPKFKVETELHLKEMLSSMGMSAAFDAGRADFSGMLAGGTEPFCITDVVHKTYIDVSEEGTEAAAVTGIMVGATAAPAQEIVEFCADRPFVYLIYDQENEEVLFLGRYQFAQ